MSRPAATPVDVSASAVVFAGPCVYKGLNVREIGGAAAVVRLRDDPAGAAGGRVACVTLAANTSFAENLTDGVRAAHGLYWEVVSGAVEGTVRVG